MSLNKSLQKSLLGRGLYFTSLFVANVFLSRSLGASSSGEIFYLSTIFSLFIIVISISLESAFTFFRKNKSVSLVQLNSLAITWVVVIGSGIYYLLKFYFVSFENLSANTTMLSLYGWLYVVGILLANYTVALCYTEDNYVLPNIAMSITNLLLIAFVFIADVLAFDKQKIVTTYFISVFAQGIFVWMSYLFFIQKSFRYQLPEQAIIKAIFKFGFTCLFANLVFFLVYRIDYWFVKNYCSQSDVGNYIQASKLGQMLLIVPQIIASVVFPQTAANNQNTAIKSTIETIIRLLLQIYFVLFLFLLCVGNSFFTWLFGTTFNSMYAAVLYLLPGIFSLSCLAILSAYFGGKNLVRINLQGAIFALVSLLLLSYLSIHQYSIIKAAMISSVAYSVNLLYSIFWFARYEKLQWKHLLQFKASDWKWLIHLFKKQA